MVARELGAERRGVQRRIREIDTLLSRRYSEPDLGNVTDVFGELVYSMLSTRSSPRNYRQAFASLRSWCGEWGNLADADAQDIASHIRECGLANRKASALSAIAKKVFRGTKGGLEHLRLMSTRDAEAVRRSLHINLVIHGRTLCGREPHCSECVLADLCKYARSRRRHERN